MVQLNGGKDGKGSPYGRLKKKSGGECGGKELGRKNLCSMNLKMSF